jgi:uncharacterized protein YigA (DUF484 family)
MPKVVVTSLGELEFESGRLVKVGGARHNYMGGDKLLQLIQELSKQMDGDQLIRTVAEMAQRVGGYKPRI